MTINEYLNKSINSEKRVDESLLLGAVVATACLTYAVKPMLDTEFMKSVGTGLGSLLGGIGGIFGSIGGLGGGLFGGMNKNKIKELLAKDPDDLTGKEKEILQKAAKDPKLQKELTGKEMKNLKKITNSTSDDDDEKDEITDEDAKELHAILKKKPGDMNQRDKEKLKKFNKLYDLSSELSDNELNAFEKATGISLGDTEEETEETPQEKQATPEEISASLTALAAKANESEKDPDKKAKTQAMLDIINASSYDDDGKLVPMSEREGKMKELVGEDNWESFTNDINEMEKNTDPKELEKALKEAKETLKEDEIKKMMEDQQKSAKEAKERIVKENKEREDLENEIEELKKSENPDKDKLAELQKKREDLINNSTLGKASPNTAKAAIERAKNNEGGGEKETNTDDDKGGKGEKETNTEPKEPKKPKSVKSKEEIQKEYDEKTAALEKELDEKTKNAKDDDEKEKLEQEWLEKKNKLDIDKLEDEYKADSAALEKEYYEKIENAKDDKEKEELENEWVEKEKKLKEAKNKAQDSIEDDGNHDTENDETKQGKYKVKDEEVTDPKTGEKIKVKTYTGPRGGKFYYPDGKPKKPENKVYVECLSVMNEHLTSCMTPISTFLKSLF